MTTLHHILAQITGYLFLLVWSLVWMLLSANRMMETDSREQQKRKDSK